ncbi:hypothetical protein TNIN_375511 [Trichonephila inaurata madagascariensis]|uniref:Uncharacterized protein n=1 Tax=Trichonephila inaurata madagascariensis TaxID=2747483 RepID=A0A8X7BXX8_9ARAC|nr:hypothetical protein TNIN_375511 [Trichonephila inaurata madagascariensis]
MRLLLTALCVFCLLVVISAKKPKADTQPKAAPVEIPEPDIQLQSDIETSKKAIHEQKQKAEVEDLHLQDLSYEESLKKDKKKRKGHHGVHHAETNQKKNQKDQKLFADQEEKNPIEEKVIEDSFEPLKEARKEGERKNKNNHKKSKKDSKNKKAYEKNNKNKKSKDGKKKYNKDNKNKDKKRW